MLTRMLQAAAILLCGSPPLLAQTPYPSRNHYHGGRVQRRRVD